MIEVFKTDVNEAEHANVIIHEIRNTFAGYEPNFDLEDCDRILRVKSTGDAVAATGVITLLKNFGYNAEILPDTEGPASPSGILYHSLNC